MKFIIILIATASLYACGETFIGNDAKNTPENNFEILWREYDQWFSQFSHKNIDWQAQYDIYRPQVTAQTSDDELWNIITGMMSVLADPHSEIDWPNKKHFNSESQEVSNAEKLFNLNLVSTYLTDKDLNADKQFYYGKLEDTIGYVYIANFDGEHTKDISSIVKGFGEITGLIVDTRSNQGGADEKAREIASIFADETRFVYSVRTKNGAGHDNFDSLTDYYLKANEQYQFTKPIVLLTNRGTVSAADVFAMMMAELPHVTIIGDYSSGAFSSKSFRRFLPNGWTYSISHQQYFTATGENLEGAGVKPDIFMDANETDLFNGEDKILESVINYLP